MSDKFPRPVDVLSMQDRFAEREVGITHPDVSSHVRLKDNGDIEVISGEGLGIVFNRKDRSMTFFADSVRMLTRDDDTGLRWNKLAFNPKATTYDQPAFIRLVESDMPNIYRGVGQFFGD